MLYTDGVHLVADSLDELYAYAEKMKLSWDWLHLGGRNVHPHFDICGHVRQRVLADKEVKLVSKKEIVRLSKLNYRPPGTEDEKKEWEAHHGKKLDDILPTESDFNRMMANIKRKTGL
ncbi:DUF4031 domain-containing protein [Aridibaculum aurantiacum]|uniref:DUF4031 domain-containing protein n=1 Tax=Aridibaculum aurantiacum TaxID=2810307 RepID=UPI001A95E3C8|nr:DUF4031 domain-containing protein [Aridibaculum aurantiacum]